MFQEMGAFQVKYFSKIKTDLKIDGRSKEIFKLLSWNWVSCQRTTLPHKSTIPKRFQRQMLLNPKGINNATLFIFLSNFHGIFMNIFIPFFLCTLISYIP